MSKCPDCEHISVSTFGDLEATIVGRWCESHAPPPSPLELARLELDEIDRANGLLEDRP